MKNIFKDVERNVLQEGISTKLYGLTLGSSPPCVPSSASVNPCPAALSHRGLLVSCHLRFMYIRLLVIYMRVFLVMGNSQNIFNPGPVSCCNQHILAMASTALLVRA